MPDPSWAAQQQAQQAAQQAQRIHQNHVRIHHQAHDMARLHGVLPAPIARRPAPAPAVVAASAAS